MLSRISKIIFSLVLVVAGVLIFIAVLHGVNSSSISEIDNSASPEMTPEPQISPISATRTELLPIRLQIPNLGIEAKVQQVGIAKSGRMAVPSNFTDVAWYKNGPAPGEVGNAVIDGHVDNGLSLPGVFKNLASIKEGDEIVVVNQGGRRLRFVVSALDAVSYKDSSAGEIFATTGTPRITLITCEGTWIPKERTYDMRLVVTAVLQGES